MAGAIAGLVRGPSRGSAHPHAVRYPAANALANVRVGDPHVLPSSVRACSCTVEFSRGMLSVL